MTSRQTVTGPVLPPKGPSASDAVGALGELTTVASQVLDYMRVRQQETTKRQELATYRELELRKIDAAEGILKAYFAYAYEERAATVTQMFTRLDEAIAAGDADTVRATLGGIVQVAQSSPLAAVGDFAHIRAAMDDPNHTWQFG